MFLLNYENEALYRVYSECDNYKIIDKANGINRVLIFFSSNSLYYPDDENTFERIIVKGNRFEGENLSKNEMISSHFGKIILVRDVFKAHYAAGINANLNDVDKLASFLREQTKGAEVYCMGGSAGGYMATLMGALLNAKRVINTSGQWRIDSDHFKAHKLVAEGHKNPETLKYYNILPYLMDSDSKVFYFYPNKAIEDIEQLKLMEEYAPQNVYTFPIRSNKHGVTISGRNIPYLLTGDEKKLIKLSKHAGSYNKYVFMAKTAGVIPAVNACISNNYQNLVFNAKIKAHNILKKLGLR